MDKVKELWREIPEPVREGLKEFLRLLIFNLVAYVASGGDLDRTIAWTIVLRCADKVIHKYGKENDNDFLIGGLSRF